MMGTLFIGCNPYLVMTVVKGNQRHGPLLLAKGRASIDGLGLLRGTRAEFYCYLFNYLKVVKLKWQI